MTNIELDDEFKLDDEEEEEEHDEQEVECEEEEDLLSNDEAELGEFNPIPYHFKLKDILGKPVDLMPDEMAKVRVNCPPFHTLLDHCLAVLWIVFGTDATSHSMLHSGDLNWAIKFLEGLKNSQNRRTEDVQMALEFLETVLHDLIVNIEVDRVRERKKKRYMDLSRSIYSLKFNKGVLLKNTSERVPNYDAFALCLNPENNFNCTNQNNPSCENKVQLGRDQGNPCQSTPFQCDPVEAAVKCNVAMHTQNNDNDQRSSSARKCGGIDEVCEDNDADNDADVCDMLDFIGETTPIILMDLLDNKPELLARAMAKTEQSDINLNEVSTECNPVNEECLLNDKVQKEARMDIIRVALCQIKDAETTISNIFNSVNEKDVMSNGIYRQGSGTRRNDEGRRN